MLLFKIWLLPTAPTGSSQHENRGGKITTTKKTTTLTTITTITTITTTATTATTATTVAAARR